MPNSKCWPKVTIAVLSWNRFHYLKATLESARRCIKYPNLEWIVSDNESEEPGLREYVEGLNWVQHKIFRKQTHAEAMNQIVEIAQGEFLVLWPEDIQFILEGDWLVDYVELLQAHREIGSMGLDALRRSTLNDLFQGKLLGNLRILLMELYWYGSKFRRSHIFVSSRGVKVRTTGYRWLGISGAGIPSLTRTDTWRTLGPWRTKEAGGTNLADSSLGAEEFMSRRFHESRLPLQIGLPLVPVAADIVTDPLGCKAKVRGNFRYGVYTPPPEGTYYYQIMKYDEVPPRVGNIPLAFMDLVKPIGFQIPVDKDGDRRKFSINDSVICDIGKQVYVECPLEPKGGQTDANR